MFSEHLLGARHSAECRVTWEVEQTQAAPHAVPHAAPHAAAIPFRLGGRGAER